MELRLFQNTKAYASESLATTSAVARIKHFGMIEAKCIFDTRSCFRSDSNSCHFNIDDNIKIDDNFKKSLIFSN